MENKKVEIYTSTTCPYCEMAKDYFKTKGIEYEEKSTADPENRKRLVSLGIRGVPAIFVGDEHVVGFDAVAIEELLAGSGHEASEAVIEQEIIPEDVKPVEPIDASEAEEPAAGAQAEIETEESKKGGEGMKKYVCTVCGYIYDPEVGDPDNGVAPGTSFADVPEDWVCPLCGVEKDQFEEE